MDYRVLLYYKYVDIEDPETFTQEHLKFCKDLGLKGRIHIGYEGINGTVSGTVEQTNKYMETMKQDPRFSEYLALKLRHKVMRSKKCVYVSEKKL